MNMSESGRRVIYMMRFLVSGVSTLVLRECAEAGARRIGRLGSALLQHFSHRIFLAGKCTGYPGKAETTIVTIRWVTVCLI